MSRTQAYAQNKMEDFQADMSGIYSESVNDFSLDESPMTYKPTEEIMSNFSPTATINITTPPNTQLQGIQIKEASPPPLAPHDSHYSITLFY
ncbi:MAG: hypothetical protein MR215_04900 [Bacteroidales bacterium]|nr:hypothetical protein [Bacteroidales bacterium]